MTARQAGGLVRYGLPKQASPTLPAFESHTYPNGMVVEWRDGEARCVTSPGSSAS